MAPGHQRIGGVVGLDERGDVQRHAPARQEGIRGICQIVEKGQSEQSTWLGAPDPEILCAAVRLTAVEHLLDVVRDWDLRSFTDATNDRARYFRVGTRLEGRRFVPITSEHAHTEIVQPTLLLLADQRLGH